MRNRVLMTPCRKGRSKLKLLGSLLHFKSLHFSSVKNVEGNIGIDEKFQENIFPILDIMKKMIEAGDCINFAEYTGKM